MFQPYFTVFYDDAGRTTISGGHMGPPGRVFETPDLIPDGNGV